MNSQQSIILDILTNNGHVDDIIRRLRAGEDRESIADWLDRRKELEPYITKSERRDNIYGVVKRVENLFNVSTSPAAPMVSDRQWTSVTKSQALINHFFELYFTWVHPVHMLFSEFEFLECYQHDDESYCSTPLVNAICAMACHLLNSPAAGVSASDIGDKWKLREAFVEEARVRIDHTSPLPMTSIQAFAILYLAELSFGKARSGAAYLRCAADHLETRDPRYQTEAAIQISEWGVHTLNT